MKLYIITLSNTNQILQNFVDAKSVTRTAASGLWPVGARVPGWFGPMSLSRGPSWAFGGLLGTAMPAVEAKTISFRARSNGAHTVCFKITSHRRLRRCGAGSAGGDGARGRDGKRIKNLGSARACRTVKGRKIKSFKI